jgi:hypothetical protein
MKYQKLILTTVAAAIAVPAATAGTDLVSENGRGQNGYAARSVALVSENGAGQQGANENAASVPVVRLTQASEGFDWNAAGIGAGVALASALAAASALAIRKRGTLAH